MAYADLTAEQKSQLQDWLKIVRPMMGELGCLCNHLEVAKDAHTSHISAILGELVDADEIPDAAGYPGATPVTKAQLAEVLGDGNTILATNNTDTKRQLYGQFAGAKNMLG